MSDEDESTWVVFNGEIYNFKELRRELEQNGHRFRTHSDTEVIVHGYNEWGTGVFEHLNGMFGVAIWDGRAQRLVVARDPMGIKLIYFKLADGTLTFGSEIRAVLAAEDSTPNVDPTALRQFLHFRYTPAPLTIFEGIQRLEPGSMLVVQDGQCIQERWYNYAPTPFSSAKEDYEAAEELLKLYKAAVGRHLIADVPVGILLSGGLDSGLLLALMKEHGEGWPAYTIGYGSSFEDDEISDAAETARILGTPHVAVELDQRHFEESLPKIVECLEEPIASSSIVPMYFICQRARQDVKVALVGQGPDELFGGYKRHIGLRYGGIWRHMPRPFQNALGSLVDFLPRNETFKRGVHSLGAPGRIQRYENVFALETFRTVSGLFKDGVFPDRLDHDQVDYWVSLSPQMANLDELGGFQLLELRSSLPDELLMFSDKLSMAHGLEVRVPYLDRTVVEFSQRLRSSMKVRNFRGKWLHRDLCSRFLPRQILERKKKGFAVNVVDRWFRSKIDGGLSDLLLNKDSLMFAYLDPSKIRALLFEHKSGRHDHHKILFSLVMFEQWMRAHHPAQTAAVR
jgi:asparagine synthase (glutamine-hydrolysing)